MVVIRIKGIHKSYIKYFLLPLLIFMLLIFSIINIINYAYGQTPEGYEYVGTYSDEYQISSSSDDAIIMVGVDFQKTSSAIPIKSNFADIIVGLRFNNVFVPKNSTHTSYIFKSSISLFSDLETYVDDTCMVTIYYIDEENPQTFQNYTDLINRPLSVINKNWDARDLHSQKWVNTSDIYHLINARVANVTGKSLGFVIYSESSIVQRHFSAYDWDSNYSAKLYITYKLYKLKSGYEETYRGWDIYSDNISYPYDWMFSQGANGERHKQTDYNSSHRNIIFSGTSDAQSSFKQRIIRVGKYILVSNYGYIYYSIDEGKTWTNMDKINKQWSELEIYGCSDLGLFADKNGIIHCGWSSVGEGHPDEYYQLYANITILVNGTLQFSNYTILTNFKSYDCNLFMDNTNKLWILYQRFNEAPAEHDIYLSLRYANGTWKNPMLIVEASSDTRMSQPVIIVENTTSNPNAYLVYHHYDFGGTPYSRVKGRYIYDNLTLGSIETISTQGGTLNSGDHDAIINERENYIYVSWYQQVTTSYYGIGLKYKDMNVSESWSSIIWVTATNQKHRLGDIGLDVVNNKIFFSWFSEWMPCFLGRRFLIESKTWEGSQFVSDTTTTSGQVQINNYFDDFYKEYYAKDNNHTSPKFPDIDELKDWIDDTMEGGNPEYDALSYMGDWILAGMGLLGIIMIPLSFIMFGLSIKSGEFIDAVYLWIILFFVGVGFLVTWLWA